MAKVEKRSNLHIWGDVIFALFLREVKDKSKDKLGVAWEVVSPVVFVFMLSFLRGRMDGGETHGIETFWFMVYGIVLVKFFLGIVGKVSNGIKKNKPLYAFRQVQPISSIIAIAAFELIITLLVVLVIGVAAYYMGFKIAIDNPIQVILNIARVWLLATSLATLFALAGCYVPEIHRIRELAMRPMFFISGIFFSLQDFPREVWPYLNWNPLLHAVELTRYAAYAPYGHEGVSYLYLDMSILVLTFAALTLYQVSWKQAISR
ncbi:ABC transporter permease [Vibrio astriarenae]|uniref:ABC transporter permease n=1 Tax=Vibrio astriarenae TaxID=1481923 RepID=UPI00373691B2